MAVALYLDERADGKQSDAPTRIFTGQLRGHLRRLAGHIGDVLGITGAAIEFEADGRRRFLRIGDHGLDWELSERNGFFSPFAYQA